MSRLGHSGRVGAWAAVLAGLASTALALDFGGGNEITAVSGKTSPGYSRARQADGTYVPESYTFGKGGLWAGAMQDASMDKVSFLELAHAMAIPLATQNYLPSTNPATTKLLIMVYWGTTRAPEHASGSNGYVHMQDAAGTLSSAAMQAGGTSGAAAKNAGSAAASASADGELTSALAMIAAENKLREQEDLVNIRMLGYESWLNQNQGDLRGTAFAQNRRDLYDEVEQNRYFVVLMAYDFQLMWKEKKHSLLWETRFSIRQLHHQFDKDVPTMAQYAARYFGQDTHGLVHDEIPLGQVDIGEVKSLGEVKPAGEAPPK
jgi:hypothetical protein